MGEPSGGDRVYLKEYVEKLLAGHERELVLRMKSMERALDLARDEVSRRLGELNQLRGEVISDREQFVMKTIYQTHWSDLTAWRQSVSERITKIETRGVTWMAAIGLFSIIVNIALSIYFRK